MSNADDLEKLKSDLFNRKYNPRICFLCGKFVESMKLTDEHVIPKWAQSRYELWDQKLTLLNRTEIPYRYLTIPCCEDCNSSQLQPIETVMATAVSVGAEAVRKLGNKILFLWLGKIFYGILYKELMLSSDRKNPNAPPILPEEIIREYEKHLFFLQEARGKIEMTGFSSPGSIFVFKTQPHTNTAFQWDFCDNLDTYFIAVRMGEVGIIGILADGGAQQLAIDYYEELKDFPLHPIQFRELCAVFSYRSTLATRTPKYVAISDDPHKVIQLPLGGLSAKPLFEDWNTDEFAKYLAFYTGQPLEFLRPNSNSIASYIYDVDDKLTFIPFE